MKSSEEKSNTSYYQRWKNNRIESSSQILEEYKKYENLQKTRQSETAEETQIQFKVEKEFQQIPIDKGTRRKELQKP